MNSDWEWAVVFDVAGGGLVWGRKEKGEGEMAKPPDVDGVGVDGGFVGRVDGHSGVEG